jgi:prepilin-type N-terminal cleavage/methylation domain-containing protein
MKRHIKGFTLMEISVAMLIAAMVIGIAYSASLIINRAYRSYNAKHERMAELLKLDELLRRDFDRSELILKDTGGIAVHYPGHVVKYKFDTAFVLRVTIRTDTFKVKTDSVHALFEGVEAGEMNPDTERNRIDQLDLPLYLEKEKITYHYHKIYSSQDLISRKSNALN